LAGAGGSDDRRTSKYDRVGEAEGVGEGSLLPLVASLVVAVFVPKRIELSRADCAKFSTPHVRDSVARLSRDATTSGCRRAILVKAAREGRCGRAALLMI
jgi:hypothetical protein